MPRLYGFWDAAHQRLKDDEVGPLRQYVGLRLKRQNFAEICRWADGEGHRTSLGGSWTSSVMAGVLRHPAIAGLKETEDGKLVSSGGPRVITAKEFRQLRRIDEELSTERAPQREYLLQGELAVCGLCGGQLRSSPSNSGARGYQCTPSRSGRPGGCGKVRANADLLEAYLGEQVIAELLKPEVREVLEHAREELRGEVVQLLAQAEESEVRQRVLGALFARREISSASYKEADKQLKADIKQGRTRARFLEQAVDVPLGGLEDLVRWWQHAPMASKTGLCVLMLEKVRVYPALSRGSRTVDERRVSLAWRRWDQAAVRES
ncbi:zinc ribbon domain-containing protein [Streptomyces fractus]|uniref:zinc ribbon domain-containing protein n=1 Tax=Streptomyces fractus TaxID=641806 RepID=UPI003CEE51B8